MVAGQELRTEEECAPGHMHQFEIETREEFFDGDDFVTRWTYVCIFCGDRKQKVERIKGAAKW
jgi:hypothetical protein